MQFTKRIRLVRHAWKATGRPNRVICPEDLEKVETPWVLLLGENEFRAHFPELRVEKLTRD